MAERVLCDGGAMRRPAGTGAGDAPVPDGTTLLSFRDLPQKQRPTQALFSGGSARTRPTGALRCDRAPWPMRGTSTRTPMAKIGTGARNCGFLSTMKGNNGQFRKGAHIRMRADSGMTRSQQKSTAQAS
jgi:IS5 family transposase